jgi:hypothetical protein
MDLGRISHRQQIESYVLPATEKTLLEEMQCSLANCELDDDDDDDESQVHQRCIWTMAAHIYKRLYENSRRFFLGKTTAVPLRDIYHRHPQAFPKYVLTLTHVNRNARTNAPYYKRNSQSQPIASSSPPKIATSTSARRESFLGPFLVVLLLLLLLLLLLGLISPLFFFDDDRDDDDALFFFW